MKSLEKSIRFKLVDYVSGRLDAPGLRAWIGPVTWEIDNTTNEATKRLAYETSLLLDEFDYGHWTEEGLKDELSRLIELKTTVTNAVFSEPVFTITSNSFSSVAAFFQKSSSHASLEVLEAVSS